MDGWVDFPTDPGKFKLPADPPGIDFELLPSKTNTEKTMLYLFAMALLGILGTGMTVELRKPRTCHKAGADALGRESKRPTWMPLSVWRQREGWRSLT